MARPNRQVSIHRAFFENQADRVKKAISLITDGEDRLTNNQIQAVKILTETYDWFFNPPKELLPRESDNSNHSE